MIIIDNLSFAYRKGCEVLRDINATFEPGIHLVLGPNGAGKTTFFNIMAGLLVPRKGTCEIDGMSSSAHSPWLMREMMFLPDDCLFPLSTIKDMAARHAVFYPGFSPELLEGNLKAFGLSGNERLADMSLGNRKKANIAYVLSLGTKVLLLDEPANGLDIASKKTLNHMIAASANDGRYIFIATHTVHDMRNLFDSVTVLSCGHLLLSATVGHVLSRVAFISSPSVMDDALYSESGLDGWRQIIPLSHDMSETSLDFELLYTALTSGSYSQTLIETLK